MARRRGEVTEAEALQRVGLALFRDLGDRHDCAQGLEALASTAGVTGQGERAAQLLGAAAALRETIGAPLPPLEQAEVEQAVAAARAALSEAGLGGGIRRRACPLARAGHRRGLSACDAMRAPLVRHTRHSKRYFVTTQVYSRI